MWKGCITNEPGEGKEEEEKEGCGARSEIYYGGRELKRARARLQRRLAFLPGNI